MGFNRIVISFSVFVLTVTLVVFLVFAPLTVSISFDLERDPPLANRNEVTFHGVDEIPNILGILEKHDAKATFFVTGRIADRYSETLEELVDDGHEVGAHGGFFHDDVLKGLPKMDQRDRIMGTYGLIEAATGRTPRGFRATGHLVDSSTVEVLDELGFLYDSSVVPSVGGWYLYDHSIYSKEGPYHTNENNFFLEGGTSIVEVPLTPVLLNGNLDSLLGYQGGVITKIELSVAVLDSKLSGKPLVLYLHPGIMSDLPNMPKNYRAGSDLQRGFDDVLYFLDRYNAEYVSIEDLVLERYS